ncbi:GNAT family N-acetyltransferase [Clostridium sp. D2Q-14]|uniref:GNAT family N-acetyltransferase n=1 Tax=Anaeromonas gelatinilytica TaxID=2683194 RepID=UPI00193B7DD2|nr:GNAT family N-acetyltransferase [Anaeromonas gelatinilytica]MBS4536351.1 GNAT family N-acetyltransferase [Anaeromonas gelatinilytica]
MKDIKLNNGKKLIIRTAIKEYARDLIDYVNQIAKESDFLTFGKGEFNITVEKEEDILQNHFDSGNMLYIVALIDDEIVGSLNFGGGHRPRIMHTGEFGVSVLKKYWGLGIGKELVKYMIDWADEGKIIKKINLRVREDNKIAIELYKKLGFKKEGIITRDFYVNEKYYSSIQMGLELD